MAALPSFKRQQLLLDYAAIKSQCPEGIYLAPEAVNAALWSGVFFVREGPYTSATLRFQLAFPVSYPEVGPAVNFATEIFHPLLVPLTTYTFAAGALDPNTTWSASDTERLTPGSFNLRDAFPSWCSTSDLADRRSSKSTSDHESFRSEEKPSLIALLKYVKKAFEDLKFLDDLPLRAAINTNAWHAWRAYRGLPKTASRAVSPTSVESSRTPLSPVRNPGDWNWDGVWESRVGNAIDESISDATLFGSKSGRTVNNNSGIIRFTKVDDEKVRDIQDTMIQSMGLQSR